MQAKDDQRFNSKVLNRKAILGKAQLGKCTLGDSNDKHKKWDCPVLLAADINQCWELVELKKVCFDCLQKGHQHHQCTSASKCRVDFCEKGHHTLLHVTPIPPSSEQDSKGVCCALHNTQVNMTRSCRLP